MYGTILVTLDGTSTDRAIIEHVKQLAKFAQSHVVLLHVADGWAARTYGSDAVSLEINEDTAYLEKVRAELESVRNSNQGRASLWRAGRANRQMGSAEGLRSGGDEHPRTPLRCRHIPRHNRHPRPAQHQRARSPSSGEIERNAAVVEKLQQDKVVSKLGSKPDPRLAHSQLQ